MPKGRLGGPRPFSEYRLLIDPHEATIHLFVVGPLGGPRPFARFNPPVSEERIRECIVSDAGESFGAGVISQGATTNIEDLPPDARRDALEVTEKWCRGLLEASAVEGASDEEIEEEFENVKDALGVEEVLVADG